MRNLHILSGKELTSPVNLTKCISVDDITGAVTLANDLEVCIVDQNLNLQKESYKLTDESHGRIKFVHVVASPTICITCNRSMTLWSSTDNISTDFITLESDILAVEWSPDFSLGVVITDDLKLNLITSSLECLMEIELEQEGFGEAQPIAVGWGKKSTQFHGSEGKQAASKKLEAVSPVASWDDRKPVITWREDAEFFAVSWVTSPSNSSPGVSYRWLRVFSSSGELHASGEIVSGVEQGLFWRPRVSLIATSQRNPRGLDVVFFEQNGLRHGEFTLFPTNKKPEDITVLANQVKVRQLAFNRDGDILAVSIVGIEEHENNLNMVRLYTTGNYHWYCKQEINVACTALVWCPLESGRLHMIGQWSNQSASSDDVYSTTLWTLRQDGSCQRSPGVEDPALVPVIDGARLMMTPFSSMMVPPPLCAYHLTFPACVSAVSFPGNDTAALPTAATGDTFFTHCLVLLASGDLYMVTIPSFQETVTAGTDAYSGVGLGLDAAGGNGFRCRCPLPSSIEKIGVRMSTISGGSFIGPILWLSYQRILITIRDTIHLLQQTHSVWSISPKVCVQEGVLTLSSGGDGRIYLQTFAGDVYSWQLSSEFSLRECKRRPDRVSMLNTLLLSTSLVAMTSASTEPPVSISLAGETGLLDCSQESFPADVFNWEFRFPQACNEILCVTLKGATDALVLGLSSTSHQLCAGTRPLMQLCSSLVLHSDFLLVTSMMQSLICVPLDVSQPNFLQSFAEDRTNPTATPRSRAYDETLRSLEPGARLVTSVAMDTKIVVQMPRGNLEVIHPRALVLCALRRLIDKRLYKEALTLMKRHRVNLNLLFDHDPQSFLGHLDHFVLSVECPTLINLFLAEISDNDVTSNIYSNFYQRTRPSQPPMEEVESKTDRLAEALRVTLDKIDPNKYILCILTCHSKKSKPELDKALMRMKNLKDEGDIATWDQCLTHLRYLVDVTVLYRVALSTGDLKLAAQVAERTQMDPKEYLPFLNELKALPEFYRLFKIDMFLKNYTGALKHIISAGSDHFEECLQLVIDQKLYSAALSKYEPESKEFKELSSHFAEHLITSERSLFSAGLVRWTAGDWSGAADLFSRAGQWRHWVMAVARGGHLQPEEVTKQTRDMADKLKDLNRHSEAVTIYEEHLQDHDSAIIAAIEGGLWEEAARLAFTNNRSDLVTSRLAPEVLRTSSDLTERVEGQTLKYRQYLGRLVALRESHQRSFAEMLARDPADDASETVDHADLFSDTSSVSGTSLASTGSLKSSSSKASNKSSKTRRKAERKKWTLKEGSSMEEVALIEELHKLILEGQSLAGEGQRLVPTLVLTCRQATDAARNMQQALNKLLSFHSSSVTVIWDLHITRRADLVGDSVIPESMFGPQGTANAAAKSAQLNAGRKTYNLHEIFLLFPPKMAILNVKNPML